MDDVINEVKPASVKSPTQYPIYFHRGLLFDKQNKLFGNNVYIIKNQVKTGTKLVFVKI